MRLVGFFAAWLAILPSAFGWNATGHRIIAAIAYDRLTPKARARVDEMIRHHPDYVAFIRNAPSDPAARARAAFIVAAVWPDAIKGDPRFWDDTKVDQHATPLLPGFPDMKRHTPWHYYDTPYTPDGAPPVHQDPPHALSELPRMIREINKATPDMASYDLPWIEHITGDLAQPLHCTARSLESQPKGDQGGNLVFLGERSNLHALWDDSAGRDLSDAYVNKYAIDAVAAHPASKKIEKNVAKWIHEGFEVAKTQVYAFGNETGTRERPVKLPAGYEENVHRVAEAQIALAGYRLAAVLNDKLK